MDYQSVISKNTKQLAELQSSRTKLLQGIEETKEFKRQFELTLDDDASNLVSIISLKDVVVSLGYHVDGVWLNNAGRADISEYEILLNELQFQISLVDVYVRDCENAIARATANL
jgi:hypothetical protein